ncbi:MAG TPA: hypothetical protein VL984_08620 [Acidimicrobiales bacterium]|nr:hypothetical protein [Acidimicrobiales bacterium]
MGAEFLVASLWVVVLIYWFWSRRPTTADTIGLFKYELRVLQHAASAPYSNPNLAGPFAGGAGPSAGSLATAGRPPHGAPAALPVSPAGLYGAAVGVFGAPAGPSANAPAGPLPTTSAKASLPEPLALAAMDYKRAATRRRRRDVLIVLLSLVALTALAAAATASAPAVALQAVTDVALVGYLCLLVTSARAKPGNRTRAEARLAPHPIAAPVAATAPLLPAAAPPAATGDPAPQAERTAAPAQAAPERRPAHVSSGLGEVTGPLVAREYVPAHAARHARGPAGWAARADRADRAERAEGRRDLYGDFDSYASLALAN